MIMAVALIVSVSGILIDALRKARENRQNDMSLRSRRTRPSACFAVVLG